MIKDPHFTPFPFLSSFHLQMMAATCGLIGLEPESSEIRIDIGKGDLLSCQVSTPPNITQNTPTIVLIHGLGGSYQSPYMIRISRKFLKAGFRAVRVNLRGCGSGKGLSSLPYHSGNSQDIKIVLEELKKHFPDSPLHLIGFSLGGNIALKLAGEMGQDGGKLLAHVTAICPVLSLKDCSKRIEQYFVYNKYYVNSILAETQKWVKGDSIKTIYEFDQKIIALLWGYKDADDYYAKCSSEVFIDQIQVPCDILLSKDDPFIDFHRIYDRKLSPDTTIWLTEKGSHMGFIGKSHFYWLDQFLLQRCF